MNTNAQQPDPADDPPFDPAGFERRLRIDDLTRRAAYSISIALFLSAFLAPLFVGLQYQRLASLIPVLILPLLWVWISISTTRIARLLPQIGASINNNQPEHAQELIDQALKRQPVMRWARLLTYHRLAILRHRQRRFRETADLCQHLLAQPLTGPAAAAKPSLLLMLAESHLGCGHLTEAYHALDQLHRTRLDLAGALQRLALQTRYALKAGHYEHALEQGREKMQLAQLMPPPQCAAMHAMLATAAQKANRQKLAHWLWQRANLLSPPGLLDQLRQGDFEIEVVEAEVEVGEGR